MELPLVIKNIRMDRTHPFLKPRTLKQLIILSVWCFAMACSGEQHEVKKENLKLWYQQPAQYWTEALPVGNGRLGAMVFGGIQEERIQFNEETLWTGEPRSYARTGAVRHLNKIRQLLDQGKQDEATSLAHDNFMSVPLRQMDYQPFGDLLLTFPDHKSSSDYHRELDLNHGICKVSYISNGHTFKREIFASHPHQIMVVRLETDAPGKLNFSVKLGSPHKLNTVKNLSSGQSLAVQIEDGVLNGLATFQVETNGDIASKQEEIYISNASMAVIYLNAATNFNDYKTIGKDPRLIIDKHFAAISDKSAEQIRAEHIDDYQSLFNRFDLSFGHNGRDTLPMDVRIRKFEEDPQDPGLIALYVQYGRYLMISSSRSGTQPANLQGIWNQDLEPAWGSKYTCNINLEMNYWISNIANLSECQEPLFNLIQEVAETGKRTAMEHYGAQGWILHHNTDLWRGTAPINHANHGIWVGGSGWLCYHLWEHYLFTQDITFLKDQAYPLMRDAARFYLDYLVEDRTTGWLISTPSNSPETGGLVRGPTMDHQIIRSLFKACLQAGEILQTDPDFAKKLSEALPRIAPNQIGRHGQLQEWLADIDDPENHHRHVSHLWGVHPGSEINFETSPEFMEAAKKSLLFRGDEGTGWSLAWKINFWARFLEGDHAYELIKMLFRPVDSGQTNYRRGGSYVNLFDAHPPFQIDGNFGAPSGIIELLIQSHLGRIDLLPALPSILPNGEIRGVKARGGFILNFSWKNGEIEHVEVTSNAGKTCQIRYLGKEISFKTEKGETYELNNQLEIKE